MAKTIGFDARLGSYINQADKSIMTHQGSDNKFIKGGIRSYGITSNQIDTNMLCTDAVGDNCTLEAWIVPKENSDYKILIETSSSDASPLRYMSLRIRYNYVYLYYADDAGGDSYLLWIGGIKEGVPVHLIGTRTDTRHMRLYIDNKLVSSRDDGGGSPSATLNAYLLGDSSGSLPFLGDTFVANIYNHSFSPQERAASYSAFRNRTMLAEPRKQTLLKPTDSSSQVNNTLSVYEPLMFRQPSSGYSSGDFVSFTGIGTDEVHSYILRMELNKTYFISTTVTNYTGTGNIILPYSGSGGIGRKTVAGNGTYIYEYTPLNVGYVFIYKNSGCTADIKVNFIREITGLTAAYNMKPSNGNVLVDISGNGNNGTIEGGVDITQNGMAFNGTDGNVYTGDIGEYTESCSIRFRLLGAITSSSASFPLCSFTNDTAAKSFNLLLGASTVFLTDEIVTVVEESGGVYYRSGWCSATGKINAGVHTISFFRTKDNDNYAIYLDGLRVDNSYYGTKAPPILSDKVTIGWELFASFANVEIMDVRLYNYAITPQQCIDYHNSFTRVALRDTFKYEGILNEPAYWDKNSGDFEIREIALQQGEQFENGDCEAASPTLNGTSNTVYQATVTRSGEQAASGSYSMKTVVSGINGSYRFPSSALVLYKRYKIKLKAYLPSSSTGTGFNMYFSDNLFYSDTVTKDTWVSFEFDFTHVSSSGRCIDIRLKNGISGDIFYLDDFSLQEIPALPTLYTGSKYLMNNSAGVISTQSDTAYGTWEFDLYKGADGNNYIIPFISDSIGTAPSVLGYSFYIESNEQISLYRCTGGGLNQLFASNSSYTDNNTWYNIKIERLNAGGVFKDIPTLQSGLVNFSMSYFYSADKYSAHWLYTGGSGTNLCGTINDIDLVSGSIYIVKVKVKVNAGTTPYAGLTKSLGGSFLCPFTKLSIGQNTLYLSPTSSDKTGCVQFYNSSSSDCDIEISELSIQRVYPADTFAVYIKGGDFGTDEWTLVDTTGGTGTNPVTDDTYQKSAHFVADLDSGDCITNLKIKDGVYV